MKRLLLAALVLALVGAAVPAVAQIIVPPPPPPGGGVFTNPDWLKIDYHRVRADIENQVATTQVDMQFTNQGEGLAEGTFIFPLPAGAAVSQLTMWVDGQPVDAKILAADEARRIYNDIVRQYRDPALLEYIGSGAIQASVFPIPPGDSRRIQITYAQVLEVDNGLIHYIYPLKASGQGRRSVAEMSVSVSVRGQDPIGSVYSPSHSIAISRTPGDDTQFRAGFEANNYVPDADFSLYYSISSETISLNLLTYRESARDDGFFLLLVQPPLRVPEARVIPKDVIVVLDQSGSMQGVKWDQARQATAYVLENLNPADRFNLILFSTGWRVYSGRMEGVDAARGAVDWINRQAAEGGTDINGALLAALDGVDAERATTVLFITDGLATEGETRTDAILANLRAAGRPNVRIFAFGVGDDVDTFLLDSIVRDHRGAVTYVRPGERINEAVASLYNKISAPVLTDVELDFGGVTVELVYPDTLPDLFAGEQLTLVGRYRGDAANVAITLSGQVSGQRQTFTYSGLDFPARAGGEPFIARLWATRRIGDLLNTIRLRGENDELVQSVVSLSVRYGIITPYTSFLIEEDDILSREGRDRAVQQFAQEAEALARSYTGASAVDAAAASQSLRAAAAPVAVPTMTAPAQAGGAAPSGYDDAHQPELTIRTVNDRTFILRDGVWIDTAYEPDTMQTTPVAFLSDAYFALLEARPELADYFALGERVIVVLDGVAYEVTAEQRN